jgi:diguanylate cyclase (GGDEF)-like protein
MNRMARLSLALLKAATMQIEVGTLSTDEFTILAADDSPVYRRLIQQSLAQGPYNVVLAKNGREAASLFAQHHPPVVVTDWTMPDMTGLDLCRLIRTEYPDVYSHFILLTSHNNKERVIEGLAAGANDYLTKPFHTGELLARIDVGRRIVELHREIQEKNRLLEQMSLTDSLTGLPNRRALEMWAKRQLSAAARHKFPLWIIMADLDHFKRVNDTYGHDAGDRVLKGFAEILKTETRRSDICGRLGGEEFLIMLAHIEQDNVAVALERIRMRLELKKFTLAGCVISVTASFGVSKFSGSESLDFDVLAMSADSALYRAKKNGRNRIEVADLVP